VSLDSEVSKGAFYVDFVWIWNGDMTMAPEPHAHDWDEMIGLVSWADKANPRAIGGDVSININKEDYKIKQSSLIFVRKGVRHCPIEFKNIKRPVLCFTIGNTKKWSQAGGKKKS
jgi:hypothetical protein